MKLLNRMSSIPIKKNCDFIELPIKNFYLEKHIACASLSCLLDL